MVWRFGAFELDPARAELRRAGQPVEVEPQVLGVLVMLVERHGKVVAHRDLMAEVWGDRPVGPAVLASRIKSARRAIGDDGRRQQWIATEHGVGYRFVGRVDTSVDATDVSPSVPAVSAEQRSTSLDGDRVVPETMPGRGGALVEEIATRYVRGLGGVALVGGEAAEQIVAAAAAAIVERHGAAVDQTIATSDLIAFGAFARVLTSRVTRSSATSGLDRTEALRRAADELTDRWAGPHRPVLVVRERARFDALGRALVDLVVAQRLAFVLEVVGDATDSAAGLDVVVVPPPGGDEVGELASALLGGRVDPTLVADLAASCDGDLARVPELLVASRRAGSVALVDGVWSISGSLVSDDPSAWPLPPLDAGAQRAADILAVAGALPVAQLVEWCGEDAVDRLDAAGLVVDRADGRVGFASSLVRSRVGAALTGLTRHRIEALLASQDEQG